MDGVEIGRIADQSELRPGRDFALPDGSTLRIQLHEGFHVGQPVVTRNGVVLPPSATHPMQTLRVAFVMLYVVGGFTAAFGVVAIASRNESFGGVDGGIGMLVEAAVYALLAWRVSRHSLIALCLAFLLFAADAVFGVLNAYAAVMRIIIFVALARAVPIVNRLRNERQNLPVK